ncbi:MAG: hypothetical protein PVI66_12380 [Candidatus Aminicenantes bacterium]|jgi:hypothetical protein
MRMNSRLTLILTVGLFVSLSLFGKKPADNTGTWVGSATLEGMGDPNELTLVLELKDGKLTGHMSDQFETMTESPISDVELGEGTFKFSTYAIGPGGGNLTLIFKMKVDGDSMSGILEVPDMGVNGEWEATKQK